MRVTMRRRGPGKGRLFSVLGVRAVVSRIQEVTKARFACKKRRTPGFFKAIRDNLAQNLDNLHEKEGKICAIFFLKLKRRLENVTIAVTP